MALEKLNYGKLRGELWIPIHIFALPIFNFLAALPDLMAGGPWKALSFAFTD